MIQNILEIGYKIELRSIDAKSKGNEADKIYYSEVYEIESEDRLQITMPMEKTKLILLPVDDEYDATFYCKDKLYQCNLRIIDRYKSNNVYILVVEMTSNLRKFQRREYYRFSCALEMASRPLVEEEIKAVEKKADYYLTPGLPLKRSVIVDISGGGLRFLSNQKYEPDSLIYCNYHLYINKNLKEYAIVGKILAVSPVESRPGTYEHRVQYVNMDVDDREEIIKYIFEEERKSRHRERSR